MKLAAPKTNQGFTLSETMVALGLSTVLLAITITCCMALQRSLNAVDSFFAAHVQQIRIIDYLGRDVKRGLSVITSSDLKTVTITIPKYIIEAGDPEAVANPALIGTPRTPTIGIGSNGPQVNYGSSTSTVAYAMQGKTVVRTQDSVVTNVVSSADQILPQTTNVQLANTEFSKMWVTFLPIFSSNTQATAQTIAKNGTSMYATAYLRNKRRG